MLPIDILNLIGSFLRQYDQRALSLATPLYRKGREKKLIDKARFLSSEAGYDELLRYGAPVLPETLTTACIEGCLGVVLRMRQLLPWGRSDAYAAVMGGNLDILELVLSSGAPHARAVGAACNTGNIDVLRLMRSNGLNIAPSEAGIDNAVRQGHIPLLEWLEEEGIQLNFSSNALCIACYGAYRSSPYFRKRENLPRGVSEIEMARWLIEEREMIPDEHTARAAAFSGDIELFDFIYRLLPPMSVEQRKTIAHGAVERGSIPMIDHLMNMGIDALVCYRDGYAFPSIAIAEKYIARGLPLSSSHLLSTTSGGDIPMLEWLHAHGCPSCDAVISSALIGDRPKETFEWLISHGYRFQISDIDNLEEGTPTRVYKWLIEKYGDEIEEL